MRTLLFEPDGGRHSSAGDVYPCHGHGQTEHGKAIPGGHVCEWTNAMGTAECRLTLL